MSDPNTSTAALLGVGTALAAMLMGAGVVQNNPHLLSSAAFARRSLQEVATSADVPVPELVILDAPQDQLNHILEAIGNNEVMAPHLELIPADATSLEGKYEDTAEDPMVRAVSWVVTKDAMNEQDFLVDRFSLATMYFSMNGANWTDSTNWLTDSHHCDGWFGVTCCKNMLFAPICGGGANPNELIEVDLYQNNVSGNLPDTFALLQGLRVVFLSKNTIGGTIPGPALSTLPKLMKIYLQHNKLIGTIPSTLYDNEVLDTLFLQGNDLTGTFPTTLCPRCSTCPEKVRYYGIDCEEVVCTENCCRLWENCFYGND